MRLIIGLLCIVSLVHVIALFGSTPWIQRCEFEVNNKYKYQVDLYQGKNWKRYYCGLVSRSGAGNCVETHFYFPGNKECKFDKVENLGFGDVIVEINKIPVLSIQPVNE